MSRTGAISVRHSDFSSNAPAPPDQDETCPVCKTTRYFNRDMEFRINPECYHRMCKTCVERIFKDGPNQCPYAGCHKTLRLRGFKTAFFADLGVEREVDIRRRVAAVFNKVEEDFETLEDYNEYLEMVECLTSDIVSGNEEAKRKAEAQLSEWEAKHKADIERNRRLARESDEARQRRLAAEAEEARQRRMEEHKAEMEEKANAKRFREEMLDSLQSAEDGRANEAMNKILLKKRGQTKRDGALGAAGGAGGLSIRGLRDKKGPAHHVADDKPYDPYGGVRLTTQRVDLAPEKLAAYSNEWVEITRTKTEFKAGGYSPDEYLSRALFEAFSGLGVFVGEEKPDRSVATAGAREAAATGDTGGKMDVDDPF
ncbi:RNA polymerase II transcription factor B subunit 3 [Fusarium keratoplasticum]|uniref:RNA polymerase II transcription factor B subunit 3 n=1 Tax=Fusarium keratoplasticum TaxID=1328300 RepID=A0ACC0QIU5_9HYPO|nr:RNA polymerase II transcription factor B subunit 3 [Fusarium keratoplasticum]KAI8654733.1 RNA polymerase II transcription factor B subunit 3 [Fusarium keratoplasticum]KAI8655586.1 RNA polymerase II transcription factor B subunit 3 [Fusarium keratoplasticum]